MVVHGRMDLAGVPRRIRGTEFTCQCGRPGFNPWVEKSPWRMATYSSILSWKIPWTEEPGRLQFMGLQRIGHDLATECMHTHTHTYTGLVAPLHVGSSWSGINPSPALADRFLIIGPPGTPLSFYVNITTPCAVHLNWDLQLLSCVQLFVTPWHL